MSDSIEQEIRSLRAQFWSDRDPDGRAFAPLADAYRRKGDLDEARALIADGLGRLPDFSAGILAAARVHLAAGNQEEAKTHLDHLLDLDPENVIGLVERSGLLEVMGRGEGAAADRAKAERLAPGSTGAPGAAPAIEVEDDSGVDPEVDSDDTGEELDADELDPAERAEADDEPLLTRTMGELYARQGLTDRAIEVFEHLLSVEPGNAELEARLEELRGGAGDAEDAEDEEDQEEEDRDAAERPIRSYFEDLFAWVPGAVPIETLAPQASAAEAPSTDASGREEAESASGAGSAEGEDSDTSSDGGDEGPDDFQNWLKSLNP